MPTLHTQQDTNNSLHPNLLSSHHRMSKKRSKVSLMGLLLMLGLLIMCLIAGCLLATQGIQVQSLTDWLSKKSVFFLSLRLVMLVIFYVTWPWVIRYRCRNNLHSQAAIKLLIQQRYWVALLLIGIDILVHV